jgi:Protein of unknown function (DUF2911)
MRFIKILFILAAIGACYFVGKRFITKSHSPSSTAHHEKNGLEVTVEYCRPYKKNREIFGGLVPYGKVWRTGANEATIIKFTKDVNIAGKKLKAGTYTLWTVPNQNDWNIIINGEVGQWGTEYDQKRDVLRVSAPSSKLPVPLEMLIIDFTDDEKGIEMLIKWDNTVVNVPITTV